MNLPAKVGKFHNLKEKTILIEELSPVTSVELNNDDIV